MFAALKKGREAGCSLTSSGATASLHFLICEMGAAEGYFKDQMIEDKRRVEASTGDLRSPEHVPIFSRPEQNCKKQNNKQAGKMSNSLQAATGAPGKPNGQLLQAGTRRLLEGPWG